MIYQDLRHASSWGHVFHIVGPIEALKEILAYLIGRGPPLIRQTLLVDLRLDKKSQQFWVELA